MHNVVTVSDTSPRVIVGVSSAEQRHMLCVTKPLGKQKRLCLVLWSVENVTAIHNKPMDVPYVLF